MSGTSNNSGTGLGDMLFELEKEDIIFMIGVCKNKNGATVGYRLIDMSTKKVMDASIRSVINALANNIVRINNLYLDGYTGELRELGDVMDDYPVIVDGKPDSLRKVVIVCGYTSSGGIVSVLKGSLGGLIVVNADGKISKIKITQLVRSVLNIHKLKLVNKYMLFDSSGISAYPVKW